MQLIKQKLNYLTARHNIISSNIAMVDIPNAKSRDLKPFMSGSRQLRINRTNEKHIVLHNHHDFTIYQPESDVQKINGNNISLENESMRLHKNNIEHQQVIGIYNKIISMFNTAARNAK